MSDSKIPFCSESDADEIFLLACIRYLDGTMSEDEVARFGEALRVSERARDRFAYHVLQDTVLADLLVWAGNEVERKEGLGSQEKVVAQVPSNCLPKIDGQFTDFINSTSSQLTNESPNTTSFFHLGNWGWGAGTLLLVLLLFGAYRAGNQHKPLISESDSARGIVNNDTSFSAVAKGNDSKAGAGSLEVRSLHVDSGTSRFYLANIGYVIAEGPTDFEMIGPMCARLNKGRIKVRVTEESGHGFVVITPSGKVTDLGTEYDLNVTSEGTSNLVVREGTVDLQVTQTNNVAGDTSAERLVQGDGVTFDKLGKLDRIMAIVKGKSAGFQTMHEVSAELPNSVISNVSDSLRSSETKKFYEIVPGGLQEDALAFVDRVHEWNGITSSGIPKYLIGADYVRTFNDDKRSRDINITVTLSHPAKLYIFYDARLNERKWLTASFRKTGDKIGLDMGPMKNTNLVYEAGSGAGESVEHHYEIYERIVTEPGEVVLGPNTGNPTRSGMYGIAAVPLEVK